ncbi:hypothetical protein AL532_18130 [Pseudomonas monteilii]|uniref:hypothetical protein n=1 Tax=Pseudomonas monteilii TaxID=76759 RepID=UPI000CEB4EBE|nr:hypothetical protein [Pseudomonas monteilii]AVH38121.1 hypothetical protein AL532_18130 [Pseudomonas monteilii]
MQLNIQNVTPETVEVQGQTVTRAFAEGVMLAGLMAGTGRNEAAKADIIGQYLDAGLNTRVSFPKETAKVLSDRAHAAREKDRLQAEANAHAERFKSYETGSALEVARRRAKREERERKYQEMSRAVRSANGSGSWSSSEF